jgi:23S rRNA pseudouridine1911/1915/1917 synthase
MNEIPTIRLIIAPEQAGRPLHELVTEALGGELPGARLIERGGLWVDGARMRVQDARAQAGSELAIHRPLSGVYPEIQATAAQIIYEDADLLALNKPAGVYVDSTPWDAEGNYHAALVRFLAARDGAAPRLHLAHRLDRDTTGVLLATKNPAMNPAIQSAFIRGTVHKHYLAICAGAPAEDNFTIITGHGRGAHGLFRVYPAEEVGRVLVNGSRVKVMRTRFQVERRLGEAALLRAFPETGRTHQIRLHLAHLGHPLIGDARYGGPSLWQGRPAPYHLLHAARLVLPHPRGGDPLDITAPTPEWASGATISR